MAEINIYIETAWDILKTDLSICLCCGDIIYSKMYIMNLRANNQSKRIGKFCESCYNALNNG